MSSLFSYADGLVLEFFLRSPVQQFTSLGDDVDTERGVVCPTAKRLTRIIRAAQFVSSRPTITGRMLSRFVGHATHLMLVGRPMLSILNHSYQFIQPVLAANASVTRLSRQRGSAANAARLSYLRVSTLPTEDAVSDQRLAEYCDYLWFEGTRA